MILFLTRKIPHPANIGLRIRQLNLLEACSRVAPVHLVFGYDDEHELAGVNDLASLCLDIHPVKTEWQRKPDRPSLAHFLGELQTMRQLLPFQSRLFHSPAMLRTVLELAPSSRLIQVERLDMVTHVQPILETGGRSQRMILDLDDIESDVRRDWLRLAPPRGLLPRCSRHLDLVVLQRYQKRTIRNFDQVLVASDSDRRRLGGGSGISVIPNGADLNQGPFPDESDGRTLLCLGTYGYWPNVDGLRYFLENVFPLVFNVIPDVRLLIVGRDMPQEVRTLHDGARILVNADVPDVGHFYREATVSVVPLRLGGGTRVKILEAFALGTPVVSTPVGCHGLDVVDGEHLLVAGGHAEFARGILGLLGDPARRATLAGNARELVERCYSWDSTQSAMSRLAGALLDGSRR